MRTSRLLAVGAAAALALSLTACATSASESGSDAGANPASDDAFPVTIEHVYGETTIESKPERVATVAWANHEVPLALGIVPVGFSKASWGDDDDNGILPWVEEKLEALDAETPVLFDETDGIDFEAVADTNPDVILAAYSGLTQEDYDTLTEIAPVVAYPETAWGTSWRDTILFNSEAMGMADEGEALVTQLEDEISDAAAAYPQLEGKTAMFLTHVDTSDLSEVSYYTTHDTRTAFFEDLGLAFPESVATASAETESFSLTQSAEQADAFSDVDIIVTYGGDELIAALEADPLLSQMPAVANRAIVALPGTSPLGTAANPTPLSISWILDDYLELLAQAADRAA